MILHGINYGNLIWNRATVENKCGMFRFLYGISFRQTTTLAPIFLDSTEKVRVSLHSLYDEDRVVQLHLTDDHVKRQYKPSMSHLSPLLLAPVLEFGDWKTRYEQMRMFTAVLAEDKFRDWHRPIALCISPTCVLDDFAWDMRNFMACLKDLTFPIIVGVETVLPSEQVSSLARMENHSGITALLVRGTASLIERTLWMKRLRAQTSVPVIMEVAPSKDPLAVLDAGAEALLIEHLDLGVRGTRNFIGRMERRLQKEHGLLFASREAA